MATTDGNSRGTETQLGKALNVTIAQLAHVDTVLLEMGVGGTHPQRDVIRSNVLLALATNFNAIVAKSVR